MSWLVAFLLRWGIGASARTGLVISVTQKGTEEMDVTIASATSPSRMRYAGRIHTESQITLLPPEPPAAQPR